MKKYDDEDLEFLNLEDVDDLDDNFMEDEFIDEDFVDENDLMDKTARKGNIGNKSFFSKFLSHLTGTDVLVAVTGVIVLLLAVVTVSLWSANNDIKQEVANMSDVGTTLSNLQLVGESGLLAVTDALIAKQEAIYDANEEVVEEEIKDEIINCKVTYTSVEKDLKIKFVNKITEKLIPNIGFVVELTGPDKKTVTYTDDDKDGIIYKTKLASGKYTVKILDTEGIEFDSKEETVTVKDKIEYQKIDVQDEVKTEAQVNIAVEDTAVKIEQEAVLADTVEYVASTATPIANASGYLQIYKDSITDPTTLVSTGLSKSLFGYSLLTISENFVTGINVTADSNTLEAGATTMAHAGVTVSGSVILDVDWSSSDESIATVDKSSGEITANGSLTSDKTVTITATTKATDADGNFKSGSVTITVKAFVAPTFKVTEAKLNSVIGTLPVGGTPLTLIATVKSSDGTTTKTETSETAGVVTWVSSAPSIATVSANGVVTPIAVGTTNITATTVEKADDGSPITTEKCVITVTAKSLTLTMEPKFTTYVGKEDFLPASITKNEIVTKTDGTTATKDLVTWESSDKTIATVDKETGLITPIKMGSFTLTATSVEKDASNKQVTATSTVTVKANPEKDTTNLLKDNAGNQVFYISDEGKYTQATWSDFYKRGAFFIKVNTQYKYTGWQTIDNKTYFFDKNNKFITGDQIIQGVKYTFTSDGILNMGNGILGIDVSTWNGTINWTAVKNSGVSFAIIRCGFRGSASGALVEDLKFKENIKGANAAGIKVGVYFFTQAVNEIEAVQEASMVLSLVKNYNISYPIFIDTEGSGGRGDTISVSTRTAVVKAFCETIKNGGYTPGIYASKSWFNNQLTVSSLNSYKIWLAQYATVPTYSGKYDLWQYTSSGYIGGITGNVDLNYSYMGY
ncbi:MAG TPA: GH25 family lysozyme [Lachnospiraceae bacterium]|nr:GH25 family lysozyme [Lachnospiraceae bacterium]